MEENVTLDHKVVYLVVLELSSIVGSLGAILVYGQA